MNLLERVLPIGISALVLLSPPDASSRASVRALDVMTILQRWTAAERADFDAVTQYSYCERIQDDDGARTYEITMLSGTPFRRLVRTNGSPLSESASQKEDERFAESQRDRAAESPDSRAHRIAEYQKTREQAHRIVEELPHAFDYVIGSTRRVGARTLWVLEATPRSGYDPPNLEARVLAGMRGEFWIDSQTYQLFKGWARVLRPVSIEGFLAKVQPGTEFEVEQRPVADGIWLPTHLSIRSKSSIAFVFHHHTTEDRRYFAYRKAPSAACRDHPSAASS